MTALDTIRASVEPELEAYENFIERQFTADGELLSEMLHYALTSRGKGIRPLLVILSAALNASVKGAASGRRTCLAAMLVEMIHVASLIHDERNRRIGHAPRPSIGQCPLAIAQGGHSGRLHLGTEYGHRIAERPIRPGESHLRRDGDPL